MLLSAYSEDVKMIYDMHKKNHKPVELIVFGISNPLKNSWFDFNGIKLDIGNLVQVYIDLVNTYVKVLDENSSRYCYADPGNCSTFFDDRADKNEVYGSSRAKAIPVSSIMETVNNAEVFNALTGDDPGDPDSVSELVKNYPVAQYIYERFAKDNGYWSHPSAKGHIQKFNAAWKAYERKS